MKIKLKVYFFLIDLNRKHDLRNLFHVSFQINENCIVLHYPKSVENRVQINLNNKFIQET